MLLPKSSKKFIKPAAEELDCDEQLVKDVVGFFYSKLRKSLVEMKGPVIKVDNLGSFKAKSGELPKLVHKYEKHLEVLNSESFNQMSIRKDIEIRLERVRNLKAMIEKERSRRREFYKHKNANEK